jgi:hypothetical protein
LAWLLAASAPAAGQIADGSVERRPLAGPLTSEMTRVADSGSPIWTAYRITLARGMHRMCEGAGRTSRVFLEPAMTAR